MERKEIRGGLVQRVFNALIPSFLLGAREYPPSNDFSNLLRPVTSYGILGGGITQVAPWNAYEQIKGGYMTQADVYAVIRMIAKTAAGVPLYVYDIKDQKAFHALRNLSVKDYGPEFMQAYKYYHTKAYEPAGDNDPLQMLIDQPNDQEEKQEFYAGSYIYKLSTGNFMQFKPVIPDGVNRGRVQGLYNLPVQSMTVIGSGGFPKRVLGYQMNADVQANFGPDEILHSKYYNPDYTGSGGGLVGLSPLVALCGELEVDKAGSLTELNMYAFGGPKVIIGLDELLPDEMGEKQIGQIRDEFAKEKEGVKNLGKWSIIGGKISVNKIGISPVDMDIVDRKKLTKEKVCSVFGINPVVLGSSQASTESNVEQAVKQLYTNAALPEVYAMRDAFNRKITPLYQTAGVRKTVDCDLSGITELQPDFKLLADTFAALPFFKPNDILEAFKYGKSEAPIMDRYMIKSGYQLIEDLAIELPGITNMEDYGAGQ